MKTKEKRIAAGIISVFLIYVLYQYFWSPLDKKTNQVKQKLTEQKQKLTTARNNALELERIKKEMESLLLELKKTEQRLPRSKEIPRLLRNLTQTAEKYQVSILTLSPQAPAAKEYFVELPFSIQSIGNYHSLAMFLTAVAQGERIINTANLRITAQPSKEDTTKTISAGFSLITYTFKEGS